MSDIQVFDSGGGTEVHNSETTGNNLPNENINQQSPTYASAVGGSTENQNIKKYSDIIAQQKKERNIIEIKIKKQTITNKDTNEEVPIKNLTFDDLSELLFEVLGISFEDCIAADYYTGRYDTREVHLRPDIDPSKYLTKESVFFMDHEVRVIRKISDITKVTFKNVPLYVPDEEILHLCGVYGEVIDNKVYREQLKIATSKKRGTLMSPTRFVYKNLNHGISF